MNVNTPRTALNVRYSVIREVNFMNTKISNTGRCIFLMILPIAVALLICLGCAIISSFIPYYIAALLLCSVVPIMGVIFIAVYLYRCGPALFSLILIARVKNEEGMNKEELEEITLGEFIILSRTPVDEDGENDPPSDGEE